MADNMTIVHFLILVLGISLGFYINTIAGFAAALVSFPFILLVMNIRQAVGLESILFLVSSIFLSIKNYKQINKKVVGELLIGMAVGLAIGIKILKSGDPETLKKLFGIFVLLMVAYLFLQNKKSKLFKKMSLLFGFGGGFFSALFATGGPAVVVYIYNKIDEPTVVRASIIGALGVMNVLKFPLLVSTGIITPALLLVSLCLLPFFFLAIHLGHLTFNRINEKTFRNILMALLLASGISILII